MIVRRMLPMLTRTRPRLRSGAASLMLMPFVEPPLGGWQTVVLLMIVIIGVLFGPYELLMVIQRMWEQRRRERIARGEDVRPRKLPWDEDD